MVYLKRRRIALVSICSNCIKCEPPVRSPRVHRLVQMLLRVVDFPFDVNRSVALHVALDVHLFAFGDRYLLIFRREVGRH